MIKERCESHYAHFVVFFQPFFKIVFDFIENFGINRIVIAVFRFRPAVCRIIINLRGVPQVITEKIYGIFVHRFSILHQNNVVSEIFPIVHFFAFRTVEYLPESLVTIGIHFDLSVEKTV